MNIESKEDSKLIEHLKNQMALREKLESDLDPRLRKQINELNEVLRSRGYSFRELSYNYEVTDRDGLTVHFMKVCQDGFRFWFTYSYETNFGPQFWNGELTTYYDYHPDDKWYHPTAWFKIFPIHYRDLKYFDLYEENARNAILSQKPVPSGADDET